MSVALSDAEVQLIESVGLFFERLGFPRIGGRIVGLMLLAPRPLTLDEIASTLKVSKASVSTNTRTFVRVQMLDEVTVPGDRRTWFRFSPLAWDGRFSLLRMLGATIGSFAQQGMEVVAPENVAARERLQYTAEFVTFVEESAARLQEEWRERRMQRTPK